MDLRNRILSVRSQIRKDRNYSIFCHLYESLEKSNL